MWDHIPYIERFLFGASAGSSVGSFFLSFVDKHSAGIGALCAVATFLVYAFVALSRNRREKERHQQDKDQ